MLGLVPRAPVENVASRPRHGRGNCPPAHERTIGMTITFVNRFTVNGAHEDFERAFNETAEFIRRQPGRLRYTLSRDVRDANQYINVAYWDNAESLKTVLAHPDFAGH